MKQVPFDRVLREVEGVFKQWGMEIVTEIPNDINSMSSISDIVSILDSALGYVTQLAAQERAIKDTLLAFYTGYQDQLDEEDLW